MIWPLPKSKTSGCCAPGSFMTVWRQPKAPFICIRLIPLSCALHNSAFGLRVRVTSRRTCIQTHIHNELKQATFLSHRGKSEVNIWHARTVASPRFSNQSTLLVNRYLTLSLPRGSPLTSKIVWH